MRGSTPARSSMSHPTPPTPPSRGNGSEPIDSGPSGGASQRIAGLIDQIRESADKLASDHTSRGDLKILSRTLRELRYAFKVFSPYRSCRKVTVFGSARTPPDDPALPAGRRVRPRHGRARLAGRHRRGQRDHGGRPRRRRPRALDGAEHPAPLRAGRPTPSSPATPSSST